MSLQEIINIVHEIDSRLREYDKKVSCLVEDKLTLIKVIATIRQNLERSLKNPALLNKAVYDSIDLCRANFTYMDGSSGLNKKDPPLTDSEKTLPEK